MAGMQYDPPQSWIDGSSLSQNELHFEYGLPQQEIASFHNCICIYPERSAIIREGDRDKALYLLRTGKVGVFKQAGALQEQIGTIEAINFFGEMSLINDEPRSATVIAMTKNLIVYKITQPNFAMILQNPKWAELFVSRLSKDLAHSNQQLIQLTQQAQTLHRTLEEKEKELQTIHQAQAKTEKNTQLALSAIVYFQEIVKQSAIVGSKGWAFLNALVEMSHAIIHHYLPQMTVSEKLAESEVVRACLSSIRREDQEKIFQDLNNKI